uniref:Copper transport protein ATOX1 n=1 Tax=Ascaris lumbricoides TaxID=6252 RepID=A0A0M3II72_ASCLU
MQSAEHLLTSVTISFQDTFPDENTRVDDASLESFSTNFVARIRGSDILAQLFDHLQSEYCHTKRRTIFYAIFRFSTCFLRKLNKPSPHSPISTEENHSTSHITRKAMTAQKVATATQRAPHKSMLRSLGRRGWTYVFELAMTCEGCANAARKVLSKLGDALHLFSRVVQFHLPCDPKFTPRLLLAGDVSNVDIDIPAKKVSVTTTLPADTILETLMKTGKECRRIS